MYTNTIIHVFMRKTYTNNINAIVPARKSVQFKMNCRLFLKSAIIIVNDNHKKVEEVGGGG